MGILKKVRLLANGNADITALLAEALTYGDELIAAKREISYQS